MTEQQIIDMAKGAGLTSIDRKSQYLKDCLLRFYKMAIAKERQACADLCWKNQNENAFVNSYNGKRLDLLCSELIKARGEA